MLGTPGKKREALCPLRREQGRGPPGKKGGKEGFGRRFLFTLFEKPIQTPETG